MNQPGRRVSTDLSALTAAFVLVVGFTFSDDIVEFLLDLAGQTHLAATNRQWLVLSLDLALVVAAVGLKWMIRGQGVSPRDFLRQFAFGWAGLGAALVLVGHLALIGTMEHRAGLGDVASFWSSVAASVVFVGAMTILLVSALGDTPVSRSWIAPLALGTFVVQIASALWYPVINTAGGCAGEVSSSFFSDATNILSVLMLAIAVELNYVRRTATERDPGKRAAPVFTVVLMCIGLALAFSMLVKADFETRCGLAAVWHEYIAFAVVTHALAIGMSTIVWLLLVSAGEDS